MGFCNAAHAETSAATETLYGCFALQRYPIMHKGNAPYPTRSPANPMPMFSRNVRNNFIWKKIKQKKLFPKAEYKINMREET